MAVPRDDPLRPRPKRSDTGSRSVRGPRLAETVSLTPAAHSLNSHTGQLARGLLAFGTLVQNGSGVPTHSAEVGTLYQDLDTNKVYVNADGGTTWVEIGTGPGHNALTLSGAPDYITLSGQDIIRGLIDLAADVTGILPVGNFAGHGISKHTEHATWKALYTDGSGDEQELALGAAPSATLGHTYLRSEGVAAAPVMAQEMKTVTITAEDPTATEDISLVFFFQAVTIRELQCVVVGSATPSVTINPKHGTDRSAAGTALLNAATAITNTTTGQNLTSFTDNTLVADSYLWLETTAKSGTVDELHITIRYTVD